ncbi:MAG: tRNA preQ1(34) S-adenosylmethionine ribosyltransferase-isomerase QueA, partial [Terrimicrobiaceae bacterium]|nr:tRNA preQ1(34) S-adenosylmethionine ribosyltransferase-isomerase QueA [Terrimicrobiaceae bacterium]
TRRRRRPALRPHARREKVAGGAPSVDRLADYDFHLPQELIASRPLDRRDASRMLVLDRTTGEIAHRAFTDFPGYLRAGDLVVLNNSRVVRARMFSENPRVELLFLEEVTPHRWKCLVKPGRRMRVGATCRAGGAGLRVAEILDSGERLIDADGPIDFARHGQIPLPPYMRRPADTQDDARYQTVFADAEGSVAAPTAGLHFTPEVLARIPHAFLTLHVGIGTFLPVKTERIADHAMHEERYTIDAAAAEAINAAQRIVAVGTTSARVLEAQPPGPIASRSGRTAIFIHPPATLHRVGALLTNFHLPKSTLLMLVSAFAGRERCLAAYEEAIRERYRFYSYGDCMLIV